MTTPIKYTHELRAGYGFDIGQNFARAAKYIPARIALGEYAKPGCVIAYIPADPASSLGFLKYGNKDGEIRIHARADSFVQIPEIKTEGAK